MGLCGIYVRTSIEKENYSIEQQKKFGINFCKKNKFTYQVYEDIGKSGYKIDEDDPFKNRSGLTKLINDIENKIVDKVWVFEHSRLSRNETTSFVLTKIFNKHNIIFYEKDKEFDLNNPQSKMIQGILTQISQYERHLIVDRIQRGVDDSLNRGIRGMRALYGYRKSGTNEEGYTTWEPVDSEVEKIRYIFVKFLEGKSVNSIVNDLEKDVSENNRLGRIGRFCTILKKFFYTGFDLTTDGRELYRKFKNCEIDSIRDLNNKKYYVKSLTFPVQIVSINDWVTVAEKLRDNSIIYKQKHRQREDSDIATGLIECPYCELKFYSKNNNGYLVYYHWSNRFCKQRPKSYSIEKIDSLFELFFFYFYLVYDDTKVLIEESQKLIKINQLGIKERIKVVEAENKKWDKQIDSFQSIYENEGKKEKPNAKLLELTLVKETELNVKREKNNSILSKLHNELDEQVKKFEEDKMELAYYDIQETVINFVENWSNEERRTSLIKIIKRSQLFGKYLVIDTGKLLFVFNIEEENVLSEDVYNSFKNDENFKTNFLNSTKLKESLQEINKLVDLKKGSELRKKYTEKDFDRLIRDTMSYVLVRDLDNMLYIKEYHLKKEGKIDMKKTIMEKLEKLGIDYPIDDKEKLISFTSLV